MILSVIAFALGIVWLQCQSSLLAPPALWLVAISAGGLLGLYFLMRSRWQRAFVLLPVAAFIFGLGWASWLAQARLLDQLPPELEGEDVVITGRIASMPQQIERGWRFEFAVESPAQIPRRISLAWYNQGFRDGVDLRVPVLHAGERWQLTVRLKRPHGNLNPYGFDYEAFLFERGIRATGYIRPKGEQQRLETAGLGIETLREQVRSRFKQTLGEAPYAGVLVALAVGDQQAVPRSQWDLFARTGITHLVSISGLHITMLAGLAYALVNFLWRRSRWLMLHLPAQKAAVIGGVLTAFAYGLLSGFAVPAQRTLYMLAVVAIALWTRRNLASRHALALALFVVLFFDPWAVLAPGFWLSFGAVAMLFYIGAGRLQEGHWLQRWGRAQWAMSLGLLPVLLALFQQFSLVSPIANAIAIPLMSFVITPLALLATLPGLAFLLHPAHALLSGMMALMSWLAALPYSSWQQAAAPLPLILLALGGAVWLLLPKGVPARWLGVLPVLVLLSWSPPRPAPGELQVTTLDVGQGLAVHVQTATHDLLFDTGPSYSEESDSGNRIILPYLRALGVGQLDMLVVTHADNDHSGGAESVVDGVSVTQMLTSAPFEHRLAALPVAQAPCEAGQTWTWDEVRFELLHPMASDYAREGGKSNDMSCVLRIDSSHGSALLTADIEARSERALLQRVPERLKVDVMLVPHHGSKTSSLPEFIGAVDPRAVIFPVGYLNRFRHPHPSVLARYDSREIHRTDHDGALRLSYSGQGIQIASAREQRRRYWHASP